MPTIDELKIAQSLKFEDTDKLIKDLFQGNILRFHEKNPIICYVLYILIPRKKQV